MRDRTPRPLGIRGWTFPLVALTAVCGSIWVGYGRWAEARQSVEILKSLESAPARKAELRSTMVASGKTDTAEKTIVECEIERIEMRSEYKTFVGTGASTILTVVPDGTRVKKGDVLCTLDASEYEEFVRLQEIKNERARSDLLQAKLNYETAQMALKEFENGLLRQTVETQDGIIALRQMDVTRAKDRLAWSKRMLEKGYVSADQVSSAEFTLRQSELSLLRANWDKRLFAQFGAPRQIKILSSRIESARVNLINETSRYERFEERLAHYKKMVEFCTIRAPQDGMVIYANEDNRADKIEPGLSVRQQQDLFYIPDIAQTTILTYLHESVAPRVLPGMRVRARIPALQNRELEGSIEKVDPLPTTLDSITQNKFFIATVKLDSIPDSIRPEMTAQVEISLQSSDDALAIPTEAVAFEDGRPYCYVRVPDGLERRPLTVGISNRDLIEVRSGLEVGEEVIMEPREAMQLASIIRDAPELEPIVRNDEAEERRRTEETSPTAVTDAYASGVVDTSHPSGL
ncbi:MAG: efflux RND transporter periplasmic adaptor subunit [Isosphaeraceae bacterium]|nr:efflux RND transporter periplasmic adaptor subunit [Isosphaeraceae bacterium]